MHSKLLQSPVAPQARTLEEAQSIINELWAILHRLIKQNEEQAQRICDLEEKLNTNSLNSSKSPSADSNRQPNKKASSNKKAGGQAGHLGKARVWVPEEELDFIKPVYAVETCDCGHAVIPDETYTPYPSIELPPVKAVITEYRLYSGQCGKCGKIHQACPPPGIGWCLFAPRALALIGTLTGAYRLSKRLVQRLLLDVYGLTVSLGVISKSEGIVSEALKPVVEEAHDYVQHSKVVNADETGHKEKGKRQWMWVAIAGMISIFMVHASRSAEAAQELLGSNFLGLLITDRCSVYTWIDVLRRQLCWAHLKRDFTKIAERGGLSGQLGTALLKWEHEIFDLWHRFKDGRLSRTAFQVLMNPLQVEVETALTLGTTYTKNFPKTAATCKRLLKLQDALWTFVSKEDVEPTNNLAEQVIRSYVMWRKICCGTQSLQGSVYAGRILTVVGSCKLQKRNIVDFITSAISAHFGQGAVPSLIPISTNSNQRR